MGKSITAIILAGGKGERLRPITNAVPKPMVKVKGKPVLEHIVNHFKAYGITDFIFTLCYLPKVVTNYFGNGKKFGVSIRYAFEKADRPLGTAGSIKSSQKYITDTFIVASGDILRTLDIRKIIEFHRRRKAFATISVYKRFGKDPKSMIVFNREKKIIKFAERPKPQEIDPNFVWANGSFYIFEPQIFSYIPNDTKSDFGKDIFPRLLKENKKIHVFPTSDFLVDIGDIKKLKTAEELYAPYF